MTYTTVEDRSNWFIAFTISPTGWFDRLVPLPPPGTRRFHCADLHCTIAFLGCIGEERSRTAFSAVTWPGRMEISLAEVVPMGSPRHWSALSALVSQGAEPLETAMLRTRDAIHDAAQIPREQRPPKAHVTLARVSRTASAAKRHEALAWASSMHLDEVTIELTRIGLYTSSLERSRPHEPSCSTRLFRTVAEIVLP